MKQPIYTNTYVCTCVVCMVYMYVLYIGILEQALQWIFDRQPLLLFDGQRRRNVLIVALGLLVVVAGESRLRRPAAIDFRTL